ncbi:hypothetical protein [Lignipirellula cremea]|uniref:hypothetical protein n=1 Tax=Lignipirellula cremea TaxID=2528010 RepID=UPI0011A4110F|nr:hypothetical protein [Lignipirellula cremea]
MKAAVTFLSCSLLLLLGDMLLGAAFGPPVALPCLFSGFAGFLATGFCLDRWNARRALNCPGCQASLLHKMTQVMETRICPACEGRIVETGRTRSPKAVARRNRQRVKRFLAAWSWLAISLGIGVLLTWACRPAAFQKCPQALLQFPAMSLSAVWVYASTRERKYLPGALIAAILFPVSVVAYLWG